MSVLATPLPKQVQRVRVLNRPAQSEGSLSCWLVLPCDMAVDRPPLVAIHGIRRDARAQAILLRTIAIEQGRPIIAPLFDETHWRKYQLAVLKKRADSALLTLMRELRDLGIWRTETFDLCGFSGGAQFAHRFTMLYPDLVSRLSVASAGWYTFPDTASFPYGLGLRRTDKRKPGIEPGIEWGPCIAGDLERFLKIPIQVFVGSQDALQDPNLRSGPDINRQQGNNRIERARNWAEALRTTAGSRGIESNISFTILDGCAHNFRRCVEVGRLDARIGGLSQDETGLPVELSAITPPTTFHVENCTGFGPKEMDATL